VALRIDAGLPDAGLPVVVSVTEDSDNAERSAACRLDILQCPGRVVIDVQIEILDDSEPVSAVP